VLNTIPLVTNQALFDKLTWDPVRDFAPIGMVATSPHVLVVPKQVTAASVAELVSLARSRPGRMSYASAGVGTTFHICGEMFKDSTGTFILHVPYRGGGPALIAFVGKQVDLTAQAPGIINPQARDGKARLLAHWGAQRTKELEGIPTMIELGYKDVEYYIWAGLFAPKGTPAPVVNRLREAMRQVMADPAVVSIFEKAGSPAAYMDQPEFAKFVEADATRLIPVVKKIGKAEEKEK
jgi:tripartite-type tricarboxylate transporter receptor subunit TctC